MGCIDCCGYLGNQFQLERIRSIIVSIYGCIICVFIFQETFRLNQIVIYCTSVFSGNISTECILEDYISRFYIFLIWKGLTFFVCYAPRKTDCASISMQNSVVIISTPFGNKVNILYCDATTLQLGFIIWENAIINCYIIWILRIKLVECINWRPLVWIEVAKNSFGYKQWRMLNTQSKSFFLILFIYIARIREWGVTYFEVATCLNSY